MNANVRYIADIEINILLSELLHHPHLLPLLTRGRLIEFAFSNTLLSSGTGWPSTSQERSR